MWYEAKKYVVLILLCFRENIYVHSLFQTPVQTKKNIFDDDGDMFGGSESSDIFSKPPSKASPVPKVMEFMPPHTVFSSSICLSYTIDQWS